MKEREILMKARIARLEYRLAMFQLHELDARLSDDAKRLYTELCQREQAALVAAQQQLQMLRSPAHRVNGSLKVRDTP